MKIRKCSFTNYATAVGVDVPFRHGTDSFTVLMDFDVFAVLLSYDVYITVKPRRNQLTPYIQFQGEPEQPLSRFANDTPPGHQCHHSFLPAPHGRALNLINTRDMLENLNPGFHAAIHRRNEAERRRKQKGNVA